MCRAPRGARRGVGLDAAWSEGAWVVRVVLWVDEAFAGMHCEYDREGKG